MDVLTDVSQYHPCDHIHACFSAPAYPVLCGSVSPIGRWVPVWGWRDKFCAKIIMRNLLCDFIFTWHTQPPPSPPPGTCVIRVEYWMCARKVVPTHMSERRTDHDCTLTYIQKQRGAMATTTREREIHPGPWSRGK